MNSLAILSQTSHLLTLCYLPIQMQVRSPAPLETTQPVGTGVLRLELLPCSGKVHKALEIPL